jgi:hypothetical protein
MVIIKNIVSIKGRPYYYRFDGWILIIYSKKTKNIILIYFQTKNNIKNNHCNNPKHYLKT